MDEIGEKLDALLNDPKQFGKIAQLASSILGDGGGKQAPPSAPESVQTRPHAMPNTHPASLPTCIETHATRTGTKQSFTPKNRGLPKLTVCNTRTSSTSAAYKPHIRAFLYRSRMVSRLSVCRFSAY